MARATRQHSLRTGGNNTRTIRREGESRVRSRARGTCRRALVIVHDDVYRRHASSRRTRRRPRLARFERAHARNASPLWWSTSSASSPVARRRSAGSRRSRGSGKAETEVRDQQIADICAQWDRSVTQMQTARDENVAHVTERLRYVEEVEFPPSARNSRTPRCGARAPSPRARRPNSASPSPRKTPDASPPSETVASPPPPPISSARSRSASTTPRTRTPKRVGGGGGGAKARLRTARRASPPSPPTRRDLEHPRRRGGGSSGQSVHKTLRRRTSRRVASAAASSAASAASSAAASARAAKDESKLGEGRRHPTRGCGATCVGQLHHAEEHGLVVHHRHAQHRTPQLPQPPPLRGGICDRRLNRNLAPP